MRYSQNGWTVYESSAGLWPFRWVTGRVRGGSVFTVLDYLAKRFNDEVEPIDRASSWGYANRPIRGSRFTSNHASATATDFNATRHPLGKRGTFTAEQRATIRQILSDLDGVVRWGGDYSGRPDEMHFEIVGTEADVSRVAARILSGAIQVSDPQPVTPTPPAPTPIAPLPAPLDTLLEPPMQTRIRVKDDQPRHPGGIYLVDLVHLTFIGLDGTANEALDDIGLDLVPVTSDERDRVRQVVVSLRHPSNTNRVDD